MSSISDPDETGKDVSGARQSAEVEAQNFWLSWYTDVSLTEFELHSPWWVSGYTDDETIMVAAVRATDERAAFAQVRAAYDNDPGPLRERFCESMGHETPFSGRFPQAEWMAWDADRTCGCPAHATPPGQRQAAERPTGSDA